MLMLKASQQSGGMMLGTGAIQSRIFNQCNFLFFLLQPEAHFEIFTDAALRPTDFKHKL